MLLATDRQVTSLAQISGWTDGFTHILAEDIGRIAWNIFLALIPLTLSFFLFYKPRSRVFCRGTYLLLVISFIIGIKKYNDGNFLIALQKVALSLWGVRAIFVAIAIGSIAVLLTLDLRFRSATNKPRSLLWWFGLLPFIAILPNAPYILTDIIHFYTAVRTIDSVWAITLVIVPIYIVFIGVGWFAYVCSLVNISKYLSKANLDRYTSIVEVSIHFICAIGIYIGRFIRFNSWSLVTHPQQFLSVLPGELIGKFPLVVILITFLIITVLYTISKPIIERSAIYSHP
jgi:uncharacterized membrane protein